MPAEQGAAGATLATVLVSRVRGSIMRGEYGPGTRLPLERMGADLGVSLSPLREALCRLESEGLVRVEDQRGYRVAPVSAANPGEVIRLRVEREGMALREAIARGDVAWEGEILAAPQRLGRCPRDPGEQGEAWEAAHRQFHAQLVCACGMPLLRQFCSMLHDQGDRYRRPFLRAHEPDRDVPAEHAPIAQATVAREADRAVALLAEHVRRTGHNIRATLPDAAAGSGRAAGAGGTGEAPRCRS